MERSLTPSAKAARPSVLTLAALVCAPLLTPAHSAAAPLMESGLEAEHVILQRGSDRVVERNRVSLASHGLRIDQDGRGFRILANYRSGELWLIDRKRRVRHQVPAVFTAEDSVEPTIPASASVGFDAGILSSAPCAGLQELDSFEARWRGRPVAISTCADADGRPLVRHWFNEDIGLVVRTMDTHGRIEELRNIAPIDLRPEYFDVDADLRRVDIAEFVGGAADIPSYDTAYESNTLDVSTPNPANFAVYPPGS